MEGPGIEVELRAMIGARINVSWKTNFPVMCLITICIFSFISYLTT